MKKILIIQPIHQEGIKLLQKNSDYEFEIVENIETEFLKKKLKIVMVFQLGQPNWVVK